jgi:transglutaminase-like putative cysteine protease
MKQLLCCCVFAMMAAKPSPAQDVPQWVREAAASAVPGFGPKISAVVLLAEERVTVESDGRIVTTIHRATRLLSREARKRAIARAVYRTDGGKVRSLNAWLLRPSLPLKKYDAAADIAAVNNDIYNEVRVKVISATDDSDAGSVFAYEAVTEERSVFAQFDWPFQDDLPTLTSRVVLSMPAGWTASSLTFNHSPVDPVVNGSIYTWEMRGLPAIEPEPAMPSPEQIVPRLAVTFVPATGTAAAFGPSFETWQSVSRWLTNLQDPQITPNAALTAEVNRLLANARAELEKIRAIGRYAQGVQYISIQTGIGRGGGYKPHTAAEIFAKSYGDCKDKVTLMRAMLKVAGIPSYPVAIYSGDPFYVQNSWPSPQQFNHAIIAISVSGTTAQSASIETPGLGRLLFFDPTDPDTSVGDLPEQLQGSFALIVAEEKGALVRIPTIPQDQSQLQRQTDLVLLPDGTINAKLDENSTGQQAALMRAEFRLGSPADFVKRIEGWISQTVPGAAITKVDPVHKPGEDNFTLRAEFQGPRYAQLMNNRLMVFKPAIVNRRSGFSFSETSRKYPVVIRAQGFTDIVRVKLPEGFKVDELPDAVKIETSFGNYSSSFELTNGLLVFTRNLSMRLAVIPADRYPEVRSFFQRVSAAEQAPVVLIR